MNNIELSKVCARIGDRWANKAVNESTWEHLKLLFY